MKLSRQDFEALALEQLDAVDRVARTMTRSSAEADDLVQETYLRAIRGAESFDLQSFGIKPWLLRIMHNLHVNRGLREKRQPKAIEAEHLAAMPDRSSEFTEADQSFAELDPEIAGALDALPTDLKTTLVLWAIDELSYKEIAQVMNVPIGTVMSRLHRVRQKMSSRLSAAFAN